MTIVNRRHFVLAAGGAIAATAVGSGALAQPAGRKLGYAIVGLGGYGLGVIIPQFKNCQHSRLVALVSGDPVKAKRVAAEYGVPETGIYDYKNYDKIRDNPDIDIVYICLPVSMHAEYTIRAAQAGKHVLCEKPMAVSAAECEAMIAACRKAGRKLMIGYRCHFEENNLEAIRRARTGEIGKLRYFRSEHGFTQGSPNSWRLKKAMSGGGSLMDIGIYALQAARYMTGEEPVAVYAHETTDRKDPRFREVEDMIEFQLEFAPLVQPSGRPAGLPGHVVVGEDGPVVPALGPAPPACERAGVERGPAPAPGVGGEHPPTGEAEVDRRGDLGLGGRRGPGRG